MITVIMSSACIALTVMFSGCAHTTPVPSEQACSDTSNRATLIRTPDGFIVELFQTPRYTLIKQITDSTGRVCTFEYDSDGQPTLIRLFDWSQLIKQADGSWYHYAPPGWWAKAVPYTVKRNDDSSVTITAPGGTVTFSMHGVRAL